MSNKMILWAKVMLSLMNKLQHYYYACEKEINRRCSFDFLLHNPEMQTMQSLMELTDLIENKKSFVKVGFLLKDSFMFLAKDERDLLKNRYSKNLSYNKIAAKSGILVSCCFRCVDKALNKFCSVLNNLGYDEEFFEREFAPINIYTEQLKLIQDGVLFNKIVYEKRRKSVKKTEATTYENYDKLKQHAMLILKENNRNLSVL